VKIGLVDAVETNDLVVAHPGKGRWQIVTDAGERRLQKAFDGVEDHFRAREANLQINLSELGLTVGTQVFVAEAAHDLEIFVKAGDHQNLLEQLRRLRQGIELTGMHTAGHEIVARTLGRGARHEWRLDLEEALRVQIFTDGDGNPVAQLDVVLHLRPTEVEIAVLKAHFLVGDRRISRRERQGFAVVKHTQFVGNDFNLACGDVLVDRVGIAQLYVTEDGDHELRAHCGGAVVHFGAGIGCDDYLRDTSAVSQIEKDKVAEIASAVYPSHEHDLGTSIGGAQCPTTMGAG